MNIFQYKKDGYKSKVTEAVEALYNSIDEEHRKLLEDNAFLAGGCFKSLILGTKVNDYDFFFTNKEAANKFCSYIKLKYPYLMLSSTRNAETILIKDNKYQFITRFTGTIEEIINSFDFKHNMNYYSLRDKKFEVNESYIRHRQIIFNVTCRHPINSLIRAINLIGEGWRIDIIDLFKMSIAINSVNLDDPDQYEDIICGPYGQTKITNYVNIKEIQKTIANKNFNNELHKVLEL